MDENNKLEKAQKVASLMQNNNIIRKFLNNLQRDDLDFFQTLVEKNLDPKDKNNVIRFKQILRHWTAWFSLYEIIQLRKSFNTLSKI